MNANSYLGEGRIMQNKMTKKAGAFKTISEVADHLQVEQHVLRFWETKFTQIKPLKRGGGRRYYRPEDVSVLERVHSLLYKEGYTIKGAQNVLKGTTRNKIAAVVAGSNDNGSANAKGLSKSQQAILEETLGKLMAMRQTLEQAS